MLTFEGNPTLKYRNIKKHRNMETVILLAIAVSLAYGVGCLGRTRKIGFGLAFLISLFNVFVGLIAVLCSKKIKKVEQNNKEN